jgi:hypothetical protein
MKTNILITAVALATFVFTSCEQTEVEMLSAEMAKSAAIENFGTTHVFTTSVDDLTQAEIEGLLLMREEEKMAGDVYDYFYEAYGLQVFDRISNSEVKHSTSVLSLIEYFGLTDPAVAEVGVFTNPEIQALYNQLTAAGSTVELALSTGAFIEEYDIADLQKLIAATTNADIIMVYTNLEKGSNNHLGAFTSSLATYGIAYEPQILKADEYAEILAGANSNGMKGKDGNKGNGGNGSGTGTGIDANGDGLCDATGEPVAQNSGASNQGNSNVNKGNNGKGNKGR